MVKTIIQQGRSRWPHPRRMFITRPTRAAKTALSPVGYVEDVAEVRTKPGSGRVLARRGRAGEKWIVFTFLPWLVDDSADHPMPIIHNIDQQAR